MKTPESIPVSGIDRAVKLMETGRLYRYSFAAEFDKDTDVSVMEDELASEVAKLELSLSVYGIHYALLSTHAVVHCF